MLILRTGKLYKKKTKKLELLDIPSRASNLRQAFIKLSKTVVFVAISACFSSLSYADEVCNNPMTQGDMRDCAREQLESTKEQFTKLESRVLNDLNEENKKYS